MFCLVRNSSRYLPKTHYTSYMAASQWRRASLVASVLTWTSIALAACGSPQTGGAKGDASFTLQLRVEQTSVSNIRAEGTDQGLNYELTDGELVVFNHHAQVAYRRTLPASYSFTSVSFASKSVIFASGDNVLAATVAAFVSTNAGRSWHNLGIFSPGNGSGADVTSVNTNSALFQILPAGANLPHLLYAIKEVHSTWSLQPIPLRQTPATIISSPLVSSSSSLHNPLFANTPSSGGFSISNAKSWLYTATAGGSFTRIAPIDALGSGNYQVLSAVTGPSNSTVVGGIYFPGSTNGTRELFIAHIDNGSNRATLVWKTKATSSFGNPDLLLLSAGSWLYGEVNDKRQPEIVYVKPSQHTSITHTFARLTPPVLKSYLFDSPNLMVVSLNAMPGLEHATATLLYGGYGSGLQAKQFSVTY